MKFFLCVLFALSNFTLAEVARRFVSPPIDIDSNMTVEDVKNLIGREFGKDYFEILIRNKKVNNQTLKYSLHYPWMFEFIRYYPEEGKKKDFYIIDDYIVFKVIIGSDRIIIGNKTYMLLEFEDLKKYIQETKKDKKLGFNLKIQNDLKIKEYWQYIYYFFNISQNSILLAN